MRSGVVVAAMVLVTGCTAGAGVGVGLGGPGGPGGSGRGTLSPEGGRPQYLNPGTLASIPGFTSVVKTGSLVDVSGQVALNDQGEVVGGGDLAAQARQTFANLSHALQIAGAIPEEVLRLNVYVVNLKPGDWDIIRREGAQFFPERNPPAGILLGIQSLPRDGLLIAVDAHAVIRATFRPRR